MPFVFFYGSFNDILRRNHFFFINHQELKDIFCYTEMPCIEMSRSLITLKNVSLKSWILKMFYITFIIRGICKINNSNDN